MATIYSGEAQRLELTAFINNMIGARIDADFPPIAMDFLNSLSEPDGPIVSIKMRLDQLEHDLKQAMPQMTGETLKVATAQGKLAASLQEINKRDAEITEKLRVAFDKVAEQLADATGKIKVVQDEMVAVGSKQRAELNSTKLQAGEFVRNAMSGISGGSGGGPEGTRATRP